MLKWLWNLEKEILKISIFKNRIFYLHFVKCRPLFMLIGKLVFLIILFFFCSVLNYPESQRQATNY